MRKVNNGLWCVQHDDELVWRYLNTTAGKAYEFQQKTGFIAWRKLNIPASGLTGYAYAMRDNGGERLNPDDASNYESAVQSLGGIPDMVRQGLLDPSDDDRRAGWRIDSHGGCTRRISDDDECLAAFLGCSPWEAEQVFADATSEPAAVTAEIPEVPPQTNSDARVVRVADNVIPVGMAAKEFPGFAGFTRRPRGFRNSQGRKIVYVAFDASRCVVAYRAGYGRDTDVEQAVSEYLNRFGWTLAA